MRIHKRQHQTLSGLGIDFLRADTEADFFSSALADNRYADTDFLEPIFGADNYLEIQSSREGTI